MDMRDEISEISDYVKSMGEENRRMTEKEIHDISSFINRIWTESDPHTAMESFIEFTIDIGQCNRDKFVRKTISNLENQLNYTREVEEDPAGHCLVAAVLINNSPDLLDSQLIRSNADNLAYLEVNYLFSEEKIKLIRKHISPYLDE